MGKKIKIDKIHLQTEEKVFALNFITKFKDVNEFAASSWNLTTTFLESIKHPNNLNPNQKVAIFLIAKSTRLLRAISMLTINGYWPEAEIILRALFETQCLLKHITQDNSQSRAKKWLKAKKWPIGHIIKQHYPKLSKVYENLSRYPHSNVLSITKYVKFKNNKFLTEIGPLKGKESFMRSEKVLGTTAMMNVAICEISAPHFDLKPQWEKEHVELMKMSYFKKEASLGKKLTNN